MKSNLGLILFIFIGSLQALAQEESRRGIALEISAGYPELSIFTQNQTAKYNGFSLQGNVLFPLASGLNYSFDIDLSYTLDSLENNASNAAEAEWAHFNGFGTGARLRISYLEAGIAYNYLKGKHLRAGTNTQIYDYNFNPVIWKVGLNIPLSSNTSVGIGYSANLDTKVVSQNETLQIKNESFWFRMQIDFGLNFVNIMKVEESFTSTRGSFFSN